MEDNRQSALDSLTPAQREEARAKEEFVRAHKEESERAQAKTEESKNKLNLIKKELERAQARTEEAEKELKLTRERLDAVNECRNSYRQEIKKKDEEIERLKKELKMLDLVILALKILRQPVNTLRLNCSNQARLCRW